MDKRNAAGVLLDEPDGIVPGNAGGLLTALERFGTKLVHNHVDRVELPDIDLDFQDVDRVKDILRRDFGEDNVACISTYGTSQIKGLLKDVSRVFDIDHNECNKVNAMIEREMKALYAEKDMKNVSTSQTAAKAKIDVGSDRNGNSDVYIRTWHMARQKDGRAFYVVWFQPEDGGAPAPLIDALHRILWLVENQPRNLNRFLDEARPDRERLRLVAQALAGTALAGKKDNGPEHTVATTAAEQAALKKLVANWRALIDQRLAADEGTLFDMGRK